MMKNTYYEVYDGDRLVTSLGGDNWCYAALGKQPMNESCGGCTGCCIAQAEYYGMTVKDVTKKPEFERDAILKNWFTKEGI